MKYKYRGSEYDPSTRPSLNLKDQVGQYRGSEFKFSELKKNTPVKAKHGFYRGAKWEV